MNSTMHGMTKSSEVYSWPLFSRLSFPLSCCATRTCDIWTECDSGRLEYRSCLFRGQLLQGTESGGEVHVI